MNPLWSNETFDGNLMEKRPIKISSGQISIENLSFQCFISKYGKLIFYILKDLNTMGEESLCNFLLIIVSFTSACGRLAESADSEGN